MRVPLLTNFLPPENSFAQDSLGNRLSKVDNCSTDELHKSSMTERFLLLLNLSPYSTLTLDPFLRRTLSTQILILFTRLLFQCRLHIKELLSLWTCRIELEVTIYLAKSFFWLSIVVIEINIIFFYAFVNLRCKSIPQETKASLRIG